MTLYLHWLSAWRVAKGKYPVLLAGTEPIILNIRKLILVFDKVKINLFKILKNHENMGRLSSVVSVALTSGPTCC